MNNNKRSIEPNRQFLIDSIKLNHALSQRAWDEVEIALTRAIYAAGGSKEEYGSRHRPDIIKAQLGSVSGQSDQLSRQIEAGWSPKQTSDALKEAKLAARRIATWCGNLETLLSQVRSNAAGLSFTGEQNSLEE